MCASILYYIYKLYSGFLNLCAKDAFAATVHLFNNVDEQYNGVCNLLKTLILVVYDRENDYSIVNLYKVYFNTLKGKKATYKSNMLLVWCSNLQ